MEIDPHTSISNDQELVQQISGQLQIPLPPDLIEIVPGEVITFSNTWDDFSVVDGDSDHDDEGVDDYRIWDDEIGDYYVGPN